MISKEEPTDSRLRVNLFANRDIGNFFWRFGFPDPRKTDLIGMQDVCGLDPFLSPPTHSVPCSTCFPRNGGSGSTPKGQRVRVLEVVSARCGFDRG